MNNENSQAMFYNVGELEGLSTDLTAKAASFKGLIDEMYALISELDTGGMWKGESFNQFNTMCTNFKTEKIEPIVKSLEGWGKGFSDIATDASNNTTANVALFDQNI